jgi:hypothetical protein
MTDAKADAKNRLGEEIAAVKKPKKPKQGAKRQSPSGTQSVLPEKPESRWLKTVKVVGAVGTILGLVSAILHFWPQIGVWKLLPRQTRRTIWLFQNHQ